MKNLLDELHKLDEEEFEVSKDFSKKIVAKINKDKKIVVFKRVTSIVAVACVATFAIVLTNKLGYLDRLKDLANSSINLSSMESANSIDTGMAVQEEKQEILQEVPQLQAEFKKNEEFDELNETNEVSEISESLEYEDAVVMNSADIAFRNATKTYSKQMKLDDYINEIHQALTDNGIKNEIISNYEIKVESENINSIYDIIENYTDVLLDFSGDIVILRVK